MRAENARLVVLGADDGVALGVGADDIGRRAIAADVVPAVLGVVLDGEDAGLRPEWAAADRLHDLPEGQIVVRHLGRRRGRAGLGSGRVVVRQADDDQIGELAAPLVFAQFLDELGGPEDVGDVHVPADRLAYSGRAAAIRCRAGC